MCEKYKTHFPDFDAIIATLILIWTSYINEAVNGQIIKFSINLIAQNNNWLSSNMFSYQTGHSQTQDT